MRRSLLTHRVGVAPISHTQCKIKLTAIHRECSCFQWSKHLESLTVKVTRQLPGIFIQSTPLRRRAIDIIHRIQIITHPLKDERIFFVVVYLIYMHVYIYAETFQNSWSTSPVTSIIYCLVSFSRLILFAEQANHVVLDSTIISSI